MNNKRFKQKGFSLIELSMVLVISSVLFALFLQTRSDELIRVRNEANMLKTIEEVQRIGTAAVAYYNQHSNHWPSFTAAAYVGGIPAIPAIPAVGGSSCSDAIAELRQSPLFNPLAPLTAGVVSADLTNYLPFMDNTSPYGQVYTTRCDADNFFIEVWSDIGNATDTAATRLNVYQAGYFVNRSAANATTCATVAAAAVLPNTGIGTAAGECRNAYLNPTNTGLGNVATNERILSSFSRFGGGGGSVVDIDPFLPTAGGTMTGDIEMTNNSDINFNAGSDVNVAVGANINVRGTVSTPGISGTGANINLEDNTSLNLASGAEINITGNAEDLGSTGINLTGFSDLNITGLDANLNLTAGADINLTTASDINIADTSSINLRGTASINLSDTARIVLRGVNIINFFSEYTILIYDQNDGNTAILTTPRKVCPFATSSVQLIPLRGVYTDAARNRYPIYYGQLTPNASSSSATEWRIDMTNQVWVDNPDFGVIAGATRLTGINNITGINFRIQILVVNYCEEI